METQTDTHIDQSVSDDEAKTEDVLFGEVADNEQSKPDNQTAESQEADGDQGSEEQSDSLFKDQDDKSADKTEDKSDDETEQEAVEYDLKLKDESLINDDVVGKLKDFAQANELSNEAAQAAYDLVDNVVDELKAADQEQWDNTVVGWDKQIQEDPDLGGEHYDQTGIMAASVLDKYAPEGFKEELIQSGFAKHPKLVKLLVNVAKASRPDSAKDTSDGQMKKQSSGDAYQDMADDLFGDDE